MISKTEIFNLQEFYLTGISVRTTNQNDQSQKDIGELWGRFMKDGLLWQIDNRVSDDICCLYTDYSMDDTRCYTTILGCKVNSLDSVAGGFTGITIPAGNYQVYYLSGKFPENVQAAWEEIWRGDVERKYTVDFDLYSANAKSFAETEVKIYLAIL